MINYYLLTKPGIILGNLIAVGAGFFLASKGNLYLALFLATMLGLTLIMASACVLNNYIDVPLDKKMKRTQKRALPLGIISESRALLFALVLAAGGALILFFFTNVLTLVVAAIGFFVYVVLYSFWKSHTVYGTAIGSIAGAVPPVAGYCAVSDQFDPAALILFAMLVLWQMPHFFAIALYHIEDYRRAQLPLLPLVKGVFRTKIHMTLYIIAFISVSLLLTLFGYTGTTYLYILLSMGIAWLALSIKGFGCSSDKLWGRDMFRLSLLVITTLCIIIPFDAV